MTAEYLTTLLKNSNTDFSGLFKSPSSNDSNGEEYFHSKTTLFTVENLVGNCIAVDYNGSSKMAKICEATTLLDVNSPGEYDCIFRNSGDDPFDRGEVLCIADSKQYSYFSKISDLSMKAECIATYSTLSPEQKEYVIDASMLTPNDVQNADDISNARHVITNPEALKMMFRLCSHALPMNLRFKCMELIREMETTTGRRSAESAMYLSDVLNAGINCEQSVEYPSFDECVKILQTYHYGDDDLLKQIALQIRLLARSDSHGCVFALLGNPGVGKTTIAKGIAECLKKTFFTIKCSGKNMVDLGGVSRIYEGSRHGAIMQGLSTYGGNSCILLDEFDDITVNDDGNPYNLFDSVWDDRKVFCDNFTDVPISVKNVCWVITCNSIDTVPAAIKNRFQANIFTINDYSCEKKVEVAKRFTVAQKMRQYNFTDREVQFTDSALLKLAKMTNDAGARVMTQIIEQTLANANIRLENGVNGPIIIDERFIDESAIVSTNSSLRKSIGF